MSEDLTPDTDRPDRRQNQRPTNRPSCCRCSSQNTPLKIGRGNKRICTNEKACRTRMETAARNKRRRL